MNTFTLFWRDGRSEIVTGATPGQALYNAGYGIDEVLVLDFHEAGDQRYNYDWDIINRWKSKITQKNAYCNGYLNSNCCDKPIIPETDICSACKEHCGTVCEDCETPCEKYTNVNAMETTFTVKINDGFCEWEFGFDIDLNNSIEKLITILEEQLKTKRTYQKLIK